MIDELDRLAGNVEFRWGLVAGVVAAVIVLVSIVMIRQRRYLTTGAVVTTTIVVVALVGMSRRSEVGDHLHDPSFRWGGLGGVLVVGALVAWFLLLARRRWVLAGALIGLAALFLLTVGYRGGVDDLFDNRGFRQGLLAGALVAAVLAVAAVMAHRRPLGVAVIGLVIAVFVAFVNVGVQPVGRDQLFASLIALGAAGILSGRWARHLALRVLVLVPGAALVGLTIGTTQSTARAVLAAAVVLVAATAVDTSRVAVGSTDPALLAITLGGVYVCVPETAVAVVVFGAAVPFGATGWPWRTLENGAALPAIVGLVVWLAFTEGQVRDSAVVGAIACLGVLLLQPALVRLRNPLPAGAVVVVHGLLVMWCARVAGLQTGAVSALVLAALGAAVALRVLQVVPWQTWGHEFRSIVSTDDDRS